MDCSVVCRRMNSLSGNLLNIRADPSYLLFTDDENYEIIISRVQHLQYAIFQFRYDRDRYLKLR